MRFFFFLLLFANAIFLAYAWYWPGTQSGGDAQIIQQQLNPEKIRLLGSDQASVLTQKIEPPKPEPARPPPPAQTACMEWGAVAAADTARAEQALAALVLGDKLGRRRVEDAAGYWVYIPPLANRQGALQKAGELKRLGVDDYFIIADDTKWRNAVSLGVFKTGEAANARLAALQAKRVRSAVVGAREAQGSKTYFRVSEASTAIAAKLNELKQDFPGTDVRECATDDRKG